MASHRSPSPALSDDSFEIIETHEATPMIRAENNPRDSTQAPPYMESTDSAAAVPPPEYSTYVAPEMTSTNLPAQDVKPQSTGSTDLYETAAEEKARLHQTYGSSQPAETPAPTRPSAEDADIPVYTPTPTGPLGEANAPITVGALNRGLAVPSNTTLISSGFPYPSAELAPYNITVEDWARFTSEITSAAKLEPAEWAVAVGTGVGTGLLSGLFVGWFGIIPGMMVAAAAQKNQERKKIEKNLYGGHGNLEQVLLGWNQNFFAPRGVLIRLDLPGQQGDIENMDVYRSMWIENWCKEHKLAKKCSKHPERRAEFEQRWERRAEKKDFRFRKRVIKRGRVVIMPLRSASTPAAESSSEKPRQIIVQ